MLDVVVVEVIFFCRRNVILHGFLDKILWVCGRGVVFGFFLFCKYLVTLQVVVTLSVFDKLLLYNR